MSTTNLFKPGGLVWRPDANNINAPEGTLLRADNLVPDEDGSLSVRRGSVELYTWPLATEDVHSLYTYEGSDGETYRMMGVDSQVYVNPHAGNHTALWEVVIAEAASLEVYLQMNYTGGSWEKDYASAGDVGPVTFTARWEGTFGYVALLITAPEPVNWNTTFAGTGDIVFGDDHQQCYMARSTSKYKFDGKSFMNWGIAKPSAVATLSAVAPASTTIIACDNTETPVAPSGAGVWYYPQHAYWSATTRDVVGSFVTDSGGTANGATKIVPGKIGKLTTGAISKGWATDQDFFDIGGKTGNDSDVFDFIAKFDDPKHVKEVQIRIDVGDPATGRVTDVRYTFSFYPKQGQAVEIRDKAVEGENAYEEKVDSSLDPVDPKDKTRTTTPAEVKSTINEVGTANTSAATTATPPGDEWIHLAVTRGQFTKIGSKSGRDWNTVRQANLIVINDDGNFSATTLDSLVVYSAGEGTLTGAYKVVYRWVRETDRYYELSPPSDATAYIYLYASQLRITIAGATQTAADDQVTDCWVYVFGGYLDTFYRAGTATADPQLATNLVIDLAKNEVEILTENEALEPYTDEPKDDIIAIAGPWNGRLFTMTSAGYVYPSLQNTPNLFNTYQVIDLSDQGDPLWMVKTSSGIHCGSERDVIFLAGSGDEEADRVVIDLYPHPLNIGTPPFDKAVFVDGNSILYRSSDGLVMLASQGLTHVPDDGIRLLWRGQTRHGVSALNTLTGRFRMTVDNKILYVLAPEGATADEGTTAVYRLDMGKGQWSRLVFPNALLAIHTEPDGTLIAGTNDGYLLQLEYGTGDDNSVKPSVVLWTPYTDGGNPLVRKDAFDLQFHANTNANTATVAVHKDGSASSSASYTFSTSIPQAYRCQADDIGTFIRAQLRITGTFDEFILSAFNLSYRVRGQHMTYLDTGYFVGDDPSDIVWLQEVEIDANTPSNLYCLVYLDDTLYTTETVTATANIRTVYRVPLPRGTKSRRPRIVVKTSAADGAGEIGFDPYVVRVRTRNSGNASSNRYRTVWPVGAAP